MKKGAMAVGFLMGLSLLLFFAGCSTTSEALVDEARAVEEEIVAAEEEEKEEAPRTKSEEVAVVIDSDGDGVPDAEDDCPGTPSGVRVDGSGCPVDSDGDGTPDYIDRCPDTPAGKSVDENGCPEQAGERVTLAYTVEFDSDSAEIRPFYYEEKQRGLDLARAYPNAEISSIIVEGHSDSTGSDAHNNTLSRRRAQTVKTFLVTQFGIDSSLIEVRAYGEKNPIASNKTKPGRQKNRRVEITLTGVIY